MGEPRRNDCGDKIYLVNVLDYLMIRVCCDICRKDLSQPHVTVGSFHFCERCSPYGEDYMREVTRLGAEGMMEIGKRIERFRNQYLKDRIVVRPEIKAVNRESA